MAIDEAALVSLPALAGLSKAQVCGRCCVWCGVVLASGHSLDLGERDLDGRHLFPRGCSACALDVVYRQLLDHSGRCEQCADNGALCTETVELRRVWKAARQNH